MNTYRKRLGISLLINIVLAAIMPEAVEYTYIQRGGELHFGGEWLLLWGAVIVVTWMFLEGKDDE